MQITTSESVTTTMTVTLPPSVVELIRKRHKLADAMEVLRLRIPDATFRSRFEMVKALRG